MNSYPTQMVITVVAVFISSVYFDAAADSRASTAVLSASYSGSLSGRDYVTDVSIADVKKGPIWRLTEPNPPLSVRAAERAASNALWRVVGETKGWKRRDIVLDDWNGGFWSYRFSFTRESMLTTNQMRSKASWLSVVVLMNGSAIAPVPKPEKK